MSADDLSHRLDAFGPVVARIVHPRWYRYRDQEVIGRGPEEIGDGAGVGHRLVEPPVPRGLGNDYWYPLVELSHGLATAIVYSVNSHGEGTA